MSLPAMMTCLLWTITYHSGAMKNKKKDNSAQSQPLTLVPYSRFNALTSMNTTIGTRKSKIGKVRPATMDTDDEKGRNID